MKNVCIIGGTGFIGRNLSAQLLAREIQTVCLSRRPPDDPMPEGVIHEILDYSHAEHLEKVFKNADAVIDLAFSSQANVGCTDFLSILPSNLEQKEILYHSALRAGVKKYLLISSGGTVYGQAINVPLTETHVTRPISTYGLAKLCLEDHARYFQTVHNLPLSIVRPSNPYGPGQKPNRGQGFIAQAIYSILSGHLITIFGDEGTIRDYVYIDDLSEAIAGLLHQNIPADTYNIGSGNGLSNRQVIEKLMPLAQVEGCEMKITHKTERPVDVRINILSSRRLQDYTGWVPRTEFSEGIKNSWLYMRKLKDRL
ncbi:MAG: NAD-dependent epimerase/dehydratase family protein [Verrucomicrobiota bacterium]|nr:NAD-dependent epimerase/dehydratase family protein [Verrucomicrobiota bacterium]